MTRAGLSRVWHLAIVLVCLAALVAQLALVISGANVLAGTARPSTAIRLVRFFSYFTIQSNLLALGTAALLAARPERDGPAWRVARVAALVGITVTFVVYIVALRPLAQHRGVPWFTNLAFHYVVPLMTVGGWLLFGPRPRIDRASLVRHLAWPVTYLAWVLAFGGATGWYPYPFFNAARVGYPRTLLAALVITLVLLAVGWTFHALDRRLAATASRE
jgi:dipeptide/tripeptide permease